MRIVIVKINDNDSHFPGQVFYALSMGLVFNLDLFLTWPRQLRATGEGFWEMPIAHKLVAGSRRSEVFNHHRVRADDAANSGGDSSILQAQRNRPGHHRLEHHKPEYRPQPAG